MRIPKNHPVRPLKLEQTAIDRVTCGTCGLSWDDAKVTSMTPTPSGRCPFEAFHKEPKAAKVKAPPVELRCDLAVLRKQRLLIDTLTGIAANRGEMGTAGILDGLANFVSMLCAGLEKGDVTVYKQR